MDNYDTITTDDKAKRDDIFRQLRTSSDPLERASVKYSGNREVLSSGKRLFVSTWSVATPRPKAGY
jgi:hypothetical protein